MKDMIAVGDTAPDFELGGCSSSIRATTRLGETANSPPCAMR
jgi:hypothetical protein